MAAQQRPNNYNELTRPFKRMFKNMPLDASSVFNTLQEAEFYAEGTNKSKGVAYLGQIISVLEGDELKVYKIVPIEGTDFPYGLEEVGKTTINSDITINGVEFHKGDEIVDVLDAIVDALEHADGVIESAITYTDEDDVTQVVVPEGSTFTEAFQYIVSYFENFGSGSISNIIGDDDISVSVVGDTLKIDLLGISNPDEIVLP